MSCRKTPGNSAATSLAGFLTGAEDYTVQQAFHRAKKQAREANVTPPTQKEVETFLHDAMRVARHDDRIKEGRRAHLVSRIDAELTAVRQGALPDAASFAAWKTVETVTRQVMREHTAAPSHRAYDGSVVTVDDLNELHECVVEARAAREWLRQHGDIEGYAATHMEALAKADQEVNDAEDVLREQVLRYDTTDEGFEVLKQGGNPQFGIKIPVAERLKIARQARAQATTTHFPSHTPADIAAVREKWDNAREQVKSAHQNGKIPSELQQAEKEAQRAFYDALLGDAQVRAALNPADLRRSVRAWLSVGSDDVASRRERWAAMEAYCQQQDQRERENGTIDSAALSRRFQARQDIRRLAAELPPSPSGG